MIYICNWFLVYGQKTLCTWSGLKIATLNSSHVFISAESLGMEESDHLIISASTDCSLRLWSAQTGKIVHAIYFQCFTLKTRGYDRHCIRGVTHIEKHWQETKLNKKWDIWTQCQRFCSHLSCYHDKLILLTNQWKAFNQNVYTGINVLLFYTLHLGTLNRFWKIIIQHSETWI